MFWSDSRSMSREDDAKSQNRHCIIIYAGPEMHMGQLAFTSQRKSTDQETTANIMRTFNGNAEIAGLDDEGLV